MTTRLPVTFSNASSSIWRLWDSFGIEDAEMVGWWEAAPAVAVTPASSDVHATAYVRHGNSTLCVLGSWATTNVLVSLTIDWEQLGLSAAGATLTAPAIENVQSSRNFEVGRPIEVEASGGWFLLIKTDDDSPVANLATGARASPAKIWVSTSGSDSNPGTSSAPFLTVQKGADSARPGDTVVVRDGVYRCLPGGERGECSYGGASRGEPLTVGFPIVLNTSGSANAPITLMAEHTGKAVLDCQQHCHSLIVLVYPARHWVIDGFEIMRGNHSGVWGGGSNPASHYTLSNNHIHSIGNHVAHDGYGLTGFYSGKPSHHINFINNTWGPGIGRLSNGPGCPGPSCFHDPCKGAGCCEPDFASDFSPSWAAFRPLKKRLPFARCGPTLLLELQPRPRDL